jgi:hypothetical protein
MEMEKDNVVISISWAFIRTKWNTTQEVKEKCCEYSYYWCWFSLQKIPTLWEIFVKGGWQI